MNCSECVRAREREETTTKSIKTSESQSHYYTNKPVIHHHITHIGLSNRDPARDHCISIVYSLIPRSPWHKHNITTCIHTSTHTQSVAAAAAVAACCCFFPSSFSSFFSLHSLALCVHPNGFVRSLPYTRASFCMYWCVCHIYGPWNRTHTHIHIYTRSVMFTTSKTRTKMCAKKRSNISYGYAKLRWKSVFFVRL